MLPDHLKSLRMCIRLQKSPTKRLQNRSTKTSLLSRLMRLLHRKQLRMRQSHKLPSLHQRLPRHLEHWVLMVTPQRLQLTDCMAPGLGRATSGMMHMDVQIPLYHSLANSPRSHCHRTSAMYELISHLPLRCNMATGRPTYLRPLVQRPLDPFRLTQQLLLVCHSLLRRPINSLVLDLRFRDRKPHHRVLHLARVTEHLVFLPKSRAHLFQLHQKRIVRRRSRREPLIEVLRPLQGCQNVEMQCNQECPRPLLEQRNGINGVDQVFLR
jgi:hypothetical protein